MRIGFDAFPLAGSYGGISTYARQLLFALVRMGERHEFFAYGPRSGNWPERGWEAKNRDQIKWIRTSKVLVRKHGRLDHLDIYHGTNFKLQTCGRYGSVLTIHDLWLDRNPHYSPKLFGQHLSFYRTRRRASHASKIIAVSHFAAKEIQELYGIPAGKIRIIHHGVSAEFFPEKDEEKLLTLRRRYHLPLAPYILFVGGAEPRKNHSAVFQSFAHCPHLSNTHKVIAVGSEHSRWGHLQETSRSLGISDSIFCIGRIPQEDLRLLYSHADVFVFPSLYEGFGFPSLEAMACGAPVVTSNTTALPEVAGDAAILIDPANDEELGQAIVHVLEDSAIAESLQAKGLQRVKQFTWEQTACQTLHVYRELWS